MPSDPPPILLLVRDLIFASKISATAQAAGVAVQILRDPSQLENCAGRRLIVDLNQAGTIEAAASWKRQTGGEIIGFVSHVDTTTIESARESGFDQILPRSRFAQILPELLS